MRGDILFEDNLANEGVRQSYDVAPDGNSFAFGRRVGDESKLVITLNWFNELRERMALATKK